MPETTLENAVAEVLSLSREALGVSRARCYVMNPSGIFRLAASYGFLARSGPEDVLEVGHPLIEWVQRHRRPTHVNSLHEAGILQSTMESERYAQSLAAPIYSGSRLVGILELQDKLGGGPFGAEDLLRASRVAKLVESILGEFDDTSVAGPEPMAAEDREALFPAPGSRRMTAFPPAPDLFTSSPVLAAPESPGPPPAAVRPSAISPRATEDSFRPSSREVLGFKSLASALLMNPAIDAVVLSIWARDKADLHIEARRPFAAAGREVLLRNLESALLSIAPRITVAREKVFHVDFPAGKSEGEIHEPGGVQTSVIASEPTPLLFSLVFSRPPDSASESALKETHRLARATILQVQGTERYRSSYRSLVHFLIEPGNQAFPQLKAHALAVGSLCRRLAGTLHLPAQTVEQFTVAGLLHDIGLKDLEIPYERISGRRPLDLQELGLVRQHPIVGATLLSRIDFPYEVASLVRHHHERFDGAGYPDRLAGDRIPLGSRVIALAEAYDAMVSPHSYRAPIPTEDALETILLKAGTQFDPELARAMIDLLRSPGEDSRRPEP